MSESDRKSAAGLLVAFFGGAYHERHLMMRLARRESQPLEQNG
jgi:hypothetical protein